LRTHGIYLKAKDILPLELNRSAPRLIDVTFKILAKTLSDNRVLTFTKVKEYSIEKGFLKFIDSKTGKLREFPRERTEVEEE